MQHARFARRIERHHLEGAGAEIDLHLKDRQLHFDVDSPLADNEETVALQVVHTFTFTPPASSKVTLKCSDYGEGIVKTEHVKLTAVEVPALTHTHPVPQQP